MAHEHEHGGIKPFVLRQPFLKFPRKNGAKRSYFFSSTDFTINIRRTYFRKIRAFPLLRGSLSESSGRRHHIILSNPGVVDKTTASGAAVFQSPRVYMKREGQETAWAPDFRRLPPAGISTSCPGKEFPAAATPAANPSFFRNCLHGEKAGMA